MVSTIVSILGDYVQLNGDGLASINWPWVVGAILLVLCVYFIFKMVCIFLRWCLNV